MANSFFLWQLQFKLDLIWLLRNPHQSHFKMFSVQSLQVCWLHVIEVDCGWFREMTQTHDSNVKSDWQKVHILSPTEQVILYSNSSFDPFTLKQNVGLKTMLAHTIH